MLTVFRVRQSYARPASAGSGKEVKIKFKIKCGNGWKRAAGGLMSAGVMLAGGGLLWGQGAKPATNVPPVIQRIYDEAHRRFAASPDDAQAAWQLGRACYDRAEFSKDNAERASLANEGITACRPLTVRLPKLAEGHYYLAMNLAQLARTKLLGALPILPEMRQGWLEALAIDEKLDYAGADRYLGLLFRDAPGWPVSLGDTRKAKQYLRRAQGGAWVSREPSESHRVLNRME